MDGHGAEKFKDATLLATSARRPWSSLSAEVRSHGAGEIAPFVPTGAEITMIVKEGRPAVSSRGSGSVRQVVRASPGTTWLCPSGIFEEATRLSDDIPEVLHVYLPHHLFHQTGGDDFCDFAGTDLRYEADVTDPLVRGLLYQVLAELREETFAGGLKIDQLATDLLAVLARDHAEASAARQGFQRARGGLDRGRLLRVTEYIEAYLFDDMTLSELAQVVDFSVFHFARAFTRTVGCTPQGYIARRRLDMAKKMLVYDETSLTDIAGICRFSDQSSFNKAFRRSTGMSPGRYRREGIG